MKPLPRIALTLAPLLFRRGAAGAQSLKSRILLWSFGGLSFLFLLVGLTIALSTRLSAELAFFIIGGLSALAFIIIWAKQKRSLNKDSTSIEKLELNDAALLQHIPHDIKDNETFKSFMTTIEGRPYSSTLLSLFLGLIIGQQIKDND
jgi:hypothetical protein